MDVSWALVRSERTREEKMQTREKKKDADVKRIGIDDVRDERGRKRWVCIWGFEEQDLGKERGAEIDAEQPLLPSLSLA